MNCIFLRRGYKEIESEPPAPSEYAVTISGANSYGYVTVDGTNYTSNKTVTVSAGKTISVTVNGATSSYSSVTLNGTTVKSGNGTYEHTVNANCTITFTRNGSGTRWGYKAAITTE